MSFYLSTLDLSPYALFYQRYTVSKRFLMHQKCLIKKYCEDTILNSQQPLLVHVFLTRVLLRYSNNLNCVPHVNHLPASSCSYSQNKKLLISKPILYLSDIIPILINLIINMFVKQWLTPKISHRMLVKKHGSMLTKGHRCAVVWHFVNR